MLVTVKETRYQYLFETEHGGGTQCNVGARL